MACPLVRTALDTAKPSLSSARPHGFDPTKPSFPSARPHGFGPTKPSFPSARPHGFLPDKAFALVRSFARLWHGKAFVPVRYVRTARGPSKALAFPRPRHSCKVQRSPRNDSLLRTVLPLQQPAHVRPAVRARNQVDAPPVNPTYRHNRGCRSTKLDALARYHAVHVTTRCYGLSYHCKHPTHVRPAVRVTNPIDTPLVNHNIPSQPGISIYQPRPTI